MSERPTILLKHYNRNSLILLFLTLVSFGCDTPKAPDLPPPSPQVDSAVTKGTDEKRFKEKSEDAQGAYEEEVSQNLRPVKPSVGGATIGDEALQRSVKICNSSGFYYDRYTSKGSCTKIELAQVKCSLPRLKSILPPSLQETFSENLKKSYQGWKVDQCIDCAPKNKVEICKGPKGNMEIGTKAFFVNVNPTSGEIEGKSLLLPVRPALLEEQ